MILASAPAFSQSADKTVGIIGGVGNYEYLHGGINVPIGSHFYFETAIGLKPWDISSETYVMNYLSFGARILKKKSDGIRYIEPSLQLKAITWYFNNEYNAFVMIGVGPELRLTHQINSRLQIFANGGIIYNAMLHYERKTNEEVGWPKEWQPSFSLQINYRLKSEGE